MSHETVPPQYDALIENRDPLNSSRSGMCRGPILCRLAEFNQPATHKGIAAASAQAPGHGWLKIKIIRFLLVRNYRRHAVPIEHPDVRIGIFRMFQKVRRPGVLFALSGSYLYDGNPAMKIFFYLSLRRHFPS
jgi:hypothetical protein